MHKDAHYYAVFAFALACGFKKESAKTLAYASQYVDDAKTNQVSFEGPTYGLKLDWEEPPSLINMATCHSYCHLKTFNMGAMINNTCAFHFVPGCDGSGFDWKMRCKPEGAILEKIKDAALEEDNLVKFGVVLHAWADSFSHEGFSGLLSKTNDIKDLQAENKSPIYSMKFIPPLLVLWVRKNILKSKFDSMFDRLVPAYGHAQAIHYPDEPYIGKWEYSYDENDVYYIKIKEPNNKATTNSRNNTKIYRAAFESITKLLQTYLEKHPSHRSSLYSKNMLPPQNLYNTFLLRKSNKNREKEWIKILREMLPSNTGQKFIEYDETEWLKEAFKNYETDNNRFTEKGPLTLKRKVRRIINGAKIDKKFVESNWYRYYEAVYWYKKMFHTLCHENGLSFDHEPYYP